MCTLHGKLFPPIPHRWTHQGARKGDSPVDRAVKKIFFSIFACNFFCPFPSDRKRILRARIEFLFAAEKCEHGETIRELVQVLGKEDIDYWIVLSIDCTFTSEIYKRFYY